MAAELSPGVENIAGLGVAGAHGQAKYKKSFQFSRHEMNPSGIVDTFQIRFIQAIFSLRTKIK